MKVKCIAISDDGPAELSPWLTPGEIYHVLSVESGLNGKVWFRILANEQSVGPESLGLHSAENFEVITNFTPSNWRSRAIGGELESSPAVWQVDGFWRALYDGEENAALTFEREFNLMVREEP
jgi:hypothetical protein